MDPGGKVALVTGAASGIGRATAIALANEGCSVVVADMNEPGAAETVAMIESAGGQAAAVQVDVTKRADIERMVAFAASTFGGLDIAHNNAGIGTPRPRFPDARPEDWERTMTVDLWAVIACVQAEVPAMRKRGGGVIVNTASMAGIIPYAPDPIYNAAKHGVVGLTRGMAALKLEDNIRVNCICPGVVDTPMIRAGLAQLTDAEREMQMKVLESMPKIAPEEIAAAVLEFVRDDSLAGEAMGIMPGRPRKIIPPAIRFGNDPAQVGARMFGRYCSRPCELRYQVAPRDFCGPGHPARCPVRPVTRPFRARTATWCSVASPVRASCSSTLETRTGRLPGPTH